MRIRKILTGGVAVLAAAASVAALGVTPSSAAAPAPLVPGNVTVIGSSPRIVASPGQLINASQTVTYTVAGSTYSGVSIPANATGLVLSVSAVNPTADGVIRVWAADAGMPGTPTVSFKKGVQSTSVSVVGLSTDGKVNVWVSAKTNVLIGITGYVTPVAAPAAPVVKTIAAVASKKIDVGGSIRTRATEFATITLPAGTWDARVLGGFTGLNNVNNTVPAGVFLTGTMVVQKGATMGDGFENNVTVGGITIPRSASDTLTQDPTAAITTFITLPVETELHVKLFAYASNSSTAGSGELSANLQGATFVKVG